jgi:hypothetical protein
MLWSLLILSLPTQNATSRMRAWRALKALGAAVLRDGVYLLPARADLQAALQDVAADVRAHGGSARLLPAQAPEGEDFAALFDRAADFGALMAEMATCRDALTNPASAPDALRHARRLGRQWQQLAAVDYFPGEARRQADAAAAALETAVQRAQSPDEPQATAAHGIERLRPQDFQGRLWATRARPWVDRLACAWLIRRFIDPQARFLWLKDPARCPRQALGFDFDGARFTHVGARVSFETLLASFGLETPALLRVGAVVHHLDAGGVQPPEAAGVERVLAGMREAWQDDDQLLAVAGSVLEGLWAAFEKDATP